MLRVTKGQLLQFTDEDPELRLQLLAEYGVGVSSGMELGARDSMVANRKTGSLGVQGGNVAGADKEPSGITSFSVAVSSIHFGDRELFAYTITKNTRN